MVLLSAIVLLQATSNLAGENASAAGTITFMIGDVYVSGNGSNWEEADFDMPVMDGQQLKTGADSQCEVTLADETIVRMDSDTIQRIERPDASQDAKGKSIFVSAGKVWVNAKKMLSKRDAFKVRTNKAVCAIRGTTLSVDESSAHTRIRVHSGEVATWSSLLKQKKDTPSGPPVFSKPVPVKGPHPVPMAEWVEIVRALQQITIDSQGGYEKEGFDPDAISDDPWVAWNMQRDQQARKQ